MFAASVLVSEAPLCKLPDSLKLACIVQHLVRNLDFDKCVRLDTALGMVSAEFDRREANMDRAATMGQLCPHY